MRYQLLGRSGLRVSEICLGAMTFGHTEWGTPEADAVAMYGRFRDLGGNFVDTANEIYAEGRSEEILGRLVAGHRDDVVIATKYSFQIPGGRNPNVAGNQRKSLTRSLESSLKRLNTDYIDLLWVHGWDMITPVDEMMRALDDAVSQGKILHIGISNAPAWVVAQCNMLADWRGWTPFIGLQLEYNLIERSIERELLPMAQQLGLGIAAWSPLASGILSGKYSDPKAADQRRLDKQSFKQVDERGLAIAAEVGKVAKALGRTAPQVALNWLRAKPGVIPLIGVRTQAQFDDNLGCLDFRLDAEHVAQLDAVSAITLGYPHDFLKSIRPVAHAGFFDALDLPRR